MRSASAAYTSLPAQLPGGKNKHHLSFDHDAMLTKQNPEQVEASSDNPGPHFVYQYLKKNTT